MDHQITKYDFRKLSGLLITKSVHLTGLYFPKGIHQYCSLKDVGGVEVYKQTSSSFKGILAAEKSQLLSPRFILLFIFKVPLYDLS